MRSFKTVTIGIPVSNLAKAEKWYKKLLGDLKTIEPVPGIKELKLNQGAWLQLREIDRYETSNSIIRLETEDLYKEKNKLEQMHIQAKPVKRIEKVIAYFEFEDEDQNKLSFYQLL